MVLESEAAATLLAPLPVPAASPSVPAVSPTVPAVSPTVPAASPTVPAASPAVPAASPAVPAASHNLKVDYTVFRAMLKRLDEMKAEIKILEKEKKRDIEEKEKLRAKCLMLEELRSVNEKNRLQLPKEFARILSPYFTKEQCDIMLGIKTSNTNKWSDRDIANALTLKCISPKAYRYIRDTWKIPLPAISTLNKHVCKINCEPGILNSVLRLMKVASVNLKLNEKLCSLSFDEMSIQKQFVYDIGADKLYSPHSKVQVVMVRGFASSWKQPIYYSYDTNMTPDLLLTIIKGVENAGFSVCSMVCDLAGGNRGLLNKLGINENLTYFVNPSDNFRRIHVFADPPHLIKLIRNNFINHKISTTDGDVTLNPVIELLCQQSGDLRIGHKISHMNLRVKGFERQKVKYAVQLLSETVSNAITFLGSRHELRSENWKVTSDFILLCDQWFNLLNSSNFNDKPSRMPYNNSKHQVEILNAIVNKMQSSKIDSRRVLLPFQTGVIISSVIKKPIRRFIYKLWNKIHFY